MQNLTHLDEKGAARMVDITDKEITSREAVATTSISMAATTLKKVVSQGIKKGDVLSVARIAGIQATKQCSTLIPLCHPLQLSAVSLDFRVDVQQNKIFITCRCKLVGRTGVEMEALTGASVAALTIYDMCKALEKGMVIGETRLEKKTGGKSGTWNAND
ncbi:MAG: cyclic pyranopterin monophosphate synthase MoaC [Gammaproteobacteria bacterium]|nr:MAG: cyclic pyranopterin monophosphate synthase MoaC [Gammaproteobacteria bacterium]